MKRYTISWIEKRSVGITAKSKEEALKDWRTKKYNRVIEKIESLEEPKITKIEKIKN